MADAWYMRHVARCRRRLNICIFLATISQQTEEAPQIEAGCDPRNLILWIRIWLFFSLDHLNFLINK